MPDARPVPPAYIAVSEAARELHIGYRALIAHCRARLIYVGQVTVDAEPAPYRRTVITQRDMARLRAAPPPSAAPGRDA